VMFIGVPFGDARIAALDPLEANMERDRFF
jgi:hypothetical protein